MDLFLKSLHSIAMTDATRMQACVLVAHMLDPGDFDTGETVSVFYNNSPWGK